MKLVQLLSVTALCGLTGLLGIFAAVDILSGF